MYFLFFARLLNYMYLNIIMFYFAFSSQTHGCSHCHGIILNQKTRLYYHGVRKNKYTPYRVQHRRVHQDMEQAQEWAMVKA